VDSHLCRLLLKISTSEAIHAAKPLEFSLVDSPVTLEEGRKILERDNYCCQYCGLDGKASFDNALAMRVDFIIPRARKGKKNPENLVACLHAVQHHQGHKGVCEF